MESLERPQWSLGEILNNRNVTDEDKWQFFVVERGKYPERYVDGLERQMAEALWKSFLNRYPGLKVGPFGAYELCHAAGGNGLLRQSWAVGESKGIIEQARICAAVARNVLGAAVEITDTTP